MHYFHRESRELDTLDACELLRSQFALAADYELAVLLDYVSEISEQLLPPAEPNERFFRLLIAVTGSLAQQGRTALWPAALYFTLWAVRLSGILAPLEMSAAEREMAEEILRTPLAKLEPRPWGRPLAADLRRRLVHLIEEHVERKLVTVQYLEAID
jgi:DNA repair protein RecO (recombination protein O)